MAGEASLTRGVGRRLAERKRVKGRADRQEATEDRVERFENRQHRWRMGWEPSGSHPILSFATRPSLPCVNLGHPFTCAQSPCVEYMLCGDALQWGIPAKRL